MPGGRTFHTEMLKAVAWRARKAAVLARLARQRGSGGRWRLLTRASVRAPEDGFPHDDDPGQGAARETTGH